MTLPDERYRAVLRTREFLCDLLDNKKTPRIPKEIRQQALWCLHHYPDEREMQQAAANAPEVFTEQYERIQRIMLEHKEEQNYDSPI